MADAAARMRQIYRSDSLFNNSWLSWVGYSNRIYKHSDASFSRYVTPFTLSITSMYKLSWIEENENLTSRITKTAETSSWKWVDPFESFKNFAVKNTTKIAIRVSGIGAAKRRSSHARCCLFSRVEDDTSCDYRSSGLPRLPCKVCCQ